MTSCKYVRWGFLLESPWHVLYSILKPQILCSSFMLMLNLLNLSFCSSEAENLPNPIWRQTIVFAFKKKVSPFYCSDSKFTFPFISPQWKGVEKVFPAFLKQTTLLENRYWTQHNGILWSYDQLQNAWKFPQNIRTFQAKHPSKIDIKVMPPRIFWSISSSKGKEKMCRERSKGMPGNTPAGPMVPVATTTLCTSGQETFEKMEVGNSEELQGPCSLYNATIWWLLIFPKAGRKQCGSRKKWGFHEAKGKNLVPP